VRPGGERPKIASARPPRPHGWGPIRARGSEATLILPFPVRSLTVAAAVVLLLASDRIAADPSPAADRVVIEARADQVRGPNHAPAVANLAYEQAYGPTVAALADPAFRWLRAAPC